MPAEGGPARRMTWLGPDVMVRGWTREGHILFVTTHGQPFFRNYRAFTLDPAGGMPQMLPLGTGESPGVRPRQCDGDRPQHRRSRALEALSRRHRRPLVDRRRGQRPVPPDERARGQHHEPDVDRRSRLLPLRRRRRRQPLLVQARRRRSAAPHRPRRLLRAPRANRRHAHRLSMRRADLAASIRRPTTTQRARHPRARASHAGGAQVRAGGRQSGRLRTCIRRATASRSTCAASSSRFGLWEGAVRQHGMPDGARHRHRAVAGRRRHGGRGQRRDRRGARAGVEGRRNAHAAVGYRPRRGDARRAARRARGDRQSPQRGAVRRSRHRSADGRSIAARTAAPRTSRGRPDGAWIAYSFWTDPRHCAIKLYDVAEQGGHARDAAGVPRLRARVRSRSASICISCRSARSIRCTTRSSSS